MLWKVLIEYVRPHRKLLAAVVVFQLRSPSRPCPAGTIFQRVGQPVL